MKPTHPASAAPSPFPSASHHLQSKTRSRSSRSFSRPLPAPLSSLLIAFSFLLLLLTTGCRIAQGIADLPGNAVRAVSPRQKELQQVDYAGLQQKLLRFTDEYTARLVLSAEHLERNGQPLSPKDLIYWKLLHSAEIYPTAAGPNPLANLLDLMVVTAAYRMSVEDYWIPEVYHESGKPLLQACLESEADVWSIGESLLKPGERDQLREAIIEWHATNTEPRAAIFLRSGALFERAFSQERTRNSAEERSGILGIVNLDPLAGLDPATREIAETRLFAERAVFLAQRMPTTLRWQIELLAYNTAEMPEVQSLITSSKALTVAADRVSHTVNEIPELVRQEREAILSDLESQQSSLSSLAAEVNQTLETGTQLTTNLNTTLLTFNQLVERLGVGEPNDPNEPPGEPFQLSDVTQAAAQLDITVQHLQELLVTFEATLGSTNLARLPEQASQVVDQTSQTTQALIDHTFRRTFTLIALGCLLLLLTGLLYRWITLRMK